MGVGTSGSEKHAWANEEEQKRNAAKLAMIADLGLKRSNEIKLASTKRDLATVDMNAVERGRLSNIPGTAEHRAARGNRQAIGAWSTLRESEGGTTVEEDIAGGNLHRAGRVPRSSGTQGRGSVAVAREVAQPSVARQAPRPSVAREVARPSVSLPLLGSADIDTFKAACSWVAPPPEAPAAPSPPVASLLDTDNSCSTPVIGEHLLPGWKNRHDRQHGGPAPEAQARSRPRAPAWLVEALAVESRAPADPGAAARAQYAAGK